MIDPDGVKPLRSLHFYSQEFFSPVVYQVPQYLNVAEMLLYLELRHVATYR
jgi:hypothetical protein